MLRHWHGRDNHGFLGNFVLFLTQLSKRDLGHTSAGLTSKNNMAPARNRPPKIGANATQPPPGAQKQAGPPFWKRYLTRDVAAKVVFDPDYLGVVCAALFLFEVVLNVFIIERVSYTEIDWKAYMQEVEGFLNGTWDYKELKGDTGPLVYPAGFVYIYSALYFITNYGKNIYLAQYIFMVLYLAQTALTYRIYRKTCKIPPYALVIATLTSYRIHSIYVLRLFNDPIAIFLFYISLNLFISNKWKLGSLFFSLAVSVKMNILLYAPCLLIAYLTNLSLVETGINLFICGIIQVFLALPFLTVNPYSYIKGSFDLGRVFEHRWTVNYRFLPRVHFENPLFHLALLSLHICLLLVFMPMFKKYLTSYAKLALVTGDLKVQMQEERKRKQQELDALTKEEKQFLDQFEKQFEEKGPKREDDNVKLERAMEKITQLFVLPFFVTNLIGIACARSLHYQFYSWYFHSLLYLLFSTGYSKPTMFLILGLIEFCWNVYPSTDFSSGLLHCCHILLLWGVYRSMKK